MAKVKQDAGPTPAAGTATAEKATEPKKPGRNDLVAATTMGGKATFHFAEPMMQTGEFTSYNGGKGMHAFCCVRDQDGLAIQSGKTALKYLMHASGKSLLDMLTEQSKRGRPAKTEATAVPPIVGAVATAPSVGGVAPPVPAAVSATVPAAKVGDPFSFLDGGQSAKTPA